MKRIKIFFTLTVCSLLAATTFAQKNYLKDAEAAFLNEQYFTAKDLYKTAELKEKKPEKKIYCIFKIAECYRFLLDSDQAEQYYLRAMEGKYNDPIVYLRAADMQREQGKYKEAEKNYTLYNAKTGDKRGKDGADGCKLAIDLMKNKSRYVINPELVLNTEYYEYSPIFADRKSSEMVFSSSRPGGIGITSDLRTGQGYMDLWITTRDKKGKWGEPTPIPAPVCSEDNEGTVCFDRKGEIMYYTVCPNEKKQNLGCKIMYVERKSGKWGIPVEMTTLKSHDTISVGHPVLTNDDQTLIFASDAGGGVGGRDLWMVNYNKRDKTWSEPINLGPKINTPGDEMFPYISDDNHLYFSSDGHLGMGGLDMFKAEVVGTEKKWENPVNLGFPLNSPQHDFGIMFEAKDKGFFTSNRTGGKGRDDIYSFYLPPLLFKMTTQVVNIDGGAPLPNIEVRLTGSDGQTTTLKTDDKGTVSFELTPDQRRFVNENTSYKVEALTQKDILKAGELSAQFTTVNEEKSKEWNFVFKMRIVVKNKALCMPMLLYAYDKWDLLVDPKIPVNSQDSLLYLYDLLVENDNMIVQLRSHTDCRGNDAYNKKLAQKRAETCVNFLVSKGIPKERMVPIGMGESEPLPGLGCKEIDKLPSKQEQEAAHQRNRRTDFKIISTDYKPTQADLDLQPTGLEWITRMLERGTCN